MITEKKLIIDNVANTQIVSINPVISNNSICLREQDSGIGRWFYMENGVKKEFHCHKVKIYDHRQESYVAFLNHNGVSFTKIIQRPSRIIIKEINRNTKNGEVIKISYVNIYDTNSEENTEIFFSDLAKQHFHFLKDKEILWSWESAIHYIWGLAVYRNKNVLHTDIRRLM